jgi:hypothetical protein
MGTFINEYAFPSQILTTLAEPYPRFDEACSTWAPAITAGLTWVQSLVEPGDFSGKNPDSAPSPLPCFYFVKFSPLPFQAKPRSFA